jgi:uncharacterized protein YndB with AHSA1/START domain
MSKFVYVTYIRATPEKIWEALTKPEFQKQYWFGPNQMYQESAWKKGAAWALKFEDGQDADTGEIVEIDPPRKLVITFQNQVRPELTAEGISHVTYTLVANGDTTKLTVTQEIDVPDSKLIQGTSRGWPAVLSSLKSLLETGRPIESATVLPMV